MISSLGRVGWLRWLIPVSTRTWSSPYRPDFAFAATAGRPGTLVTASVSV